MCGIAGFLSAQTDELAEDEAKARLRAMAKAIAHRGPDDEDVWFNGAAGFAHRRLSIIDPAPHGRQPMRRGPLTIAYNGEIYNYRELRRELEDCGDAFLTSTDTEVLLAALLRWGDDALSRLNGMYAFALWDDRSGQLTLARDRIGKKPLYYAQTSGAFLFGSEIKAILSWPAFERQPDLEAIHHYLSLQYSPSPWTAFIGVRALGPGSFLKVELRGATKVTRYWSPPTPGDRMPFTASERADAEEQLKDLLSASVRRRMIADVPIGAFLSGGVDSSAVVAMMTAASSGPVETFSIGFDEPDYDERQFARIAAKKFGARHHEEIVRPDAIDVLSKIVWHYGQPFADPSAIPTYYVSRLARTRVTVALTGDGGDEFFLGYSRYRDLAAIEKTLGRLPPSMKAAAAFCGAAIPNVASRLPLVRRLKRWLSRAGARPEKIYEQAMMYFYEEDKKSGYGDALSPYLRTSTLDLLAPYFDAAPSMTTGAAYADVNTYLPDDLLVKVDVASMAFGLEARAPFLDVELMEWASRLPQTERLRDGEMKVLLRSALRPTVPAEILDRPKMGFGVPLEKWFRAELKDFAFDLFTSGAARGRGLFAPGYCESLLADHVSGRRLNHTRLWALVMLELWFRTWIDGPAPLSTPSVQ